MFDYAILGREDNHVREKNTLFKKADLILIAACLLAAALLAVCFAQRRSPGASVSFLYDGIALRTIALNTGQSSPDQAAAADGYYLITCRDDVTAVEYCADMPDLHFPEYICYNLVSVQDGAVSVEAADCRDQICVRHKPVSAAGESIVCLPHRLVVEIAGEKRAENDTPDGVAR